MQKDNSRKSLTNPSIENKNFILFYQNKEKGSKKTQSMKNRFAYSVNVLLSDEKVDCFHYFNLYPAPYVIKEKVNP